MESPAKLSSSRGLALIGAAALVATLLIMLGLGEQGLWSQLELEPWRRARAAGGEALDELLRQPFLPELLRAKCFALLGPEWGLRLPGAIATIASSAMCVAIALRLGFGALASLAGALIFLGFPVVAASAHTASGPAIAEAAIAGFLLAAMVLLDTTSSRAKRRLAALLAPLMLAASLASAGLLFGAALPLAAIAFYDLPTQDADGPVAPKPFARRVRWLAGALAGLAALLVLKLALAQGEGYIPLLGAAKDTVLLNKPLFRDITASFEALGHQVYPWAALLVIGMLLPGPARWPARWLALTVIAGSIWSAFYGASQLPSSLPAALICVGALHALLDPKRPTLLRRMLLVALIGGVWVAKSDALSRPSRVASPTHRFTREKLYPTQETQVSERLEHLAQYATLMLLLGYFASPRSRDDEALPISERLPSALRERIRAVGDERRAHLAWIILLAGLSHQAFAIEGQHAHLQSEQLSLAAVFRRHSARIANQELPAEIGLHRVRDPGLELYGPPEVDRRVLSTRKSVVDYLAEEGPRVVFVRASDHAGIHQMHRELIRPLHLLDMGHFDLRLLANFEPPSGALISPLTELVRDEAPTLAHQTFVRFEDRIEVIGWQVDGDLKRGSEIEVTLAIRVLRSLPASAKIFVRMQQGDISKINVKPHTPAQGLYPGNYWRRGDIIVDRVKFEIPSATTLPGPHEFFIGLQRTEKANFTISFPEGREGEFGVSLRGRKGREFANLATLEID